MDLVTIRNEASGYKSDHDILYMPTRLPSSYQRSTFIPIHPPHHSNIKGIQPYLCKSQRNFHRKSDNYKF